MNRWIWLDRKLARIYSYFPSLVEAHAKKLGQKAGGEIPWTPYTKELEASTVALVTTSGVHLKSRETFDLKNPEGDWTFREIPGDAAPKDLMISHSHYDHRDADKDINIVFPIERLRELAAEGIIKEISPVNFGFMGFIPKTGPLINETAPQVAEKLKKAEVDLVLLTPA